MFSVIAFDTSDSFGEEGIIRHLVKVLGKRIRSTDETGWLGTTQIGVLLPDTTAQAAGKLANDICSEVAPRIKDIAFEIYSYPSDGLSGSDKNPPRFSRGEGEQNRASAAEGNPEGPNTVLFRNSAREIASLLVQPIPLWKRVLDVLGSGLGLILLFPLLLLIAAVIKIVSPGPVFYKQERVGVCGNRFMIWKFRTMRCNSDVSIHQEYVSALYKNGKPMNKLENDPRIIPFGNILRNSFLDELPQLINVLLGDMSLVGPRPDVAYAVCEYEPWQFARFDVLPGMTGLWQVSGKNQTSLKKMVSLDVNYKKKRSFWYDLKILFLTLPAILNEIKNSKIKKI